MKNKTLYIVGLFVLTGTICARPVMAIDSQKAGPFAGQDMHLQTENLTSFQSGTDEYILLCSGGLTISVGAEKLSGDEAVVWLQSRKIEFQGEIFIDYAAKVYLKGNVSVQKGKTAAAIDLRKKPIKDGQEVIVDFIVNGQVFVTADKRQTKDPRGSDLYQRAVSARQYPAGRFVPKQVATTPEMPAEKPQQVDEKPEKRIVKEITAKKRQKPSEPKKQQPEPEKKEPVFRYPVNIAAVGKRKPTIEKTALKTEEDVDVATITGRFYLWQKQDESGGLLELQADNGVVFYSRRDSESGRQETGSENVLAQAAVKAVYLVGDVIITEEQRTITADEIYYDFQRKKAVAINAQMRNFDTSRAIPIYVRAAKLRQVAENKFTADDVILTTSEFHTPQVSLNASNIVVTDTTVADERTGEVTDSSYDAQMRNVRLKSYDRTVFYWPFLRSNMQRPDIPLKSIHTGYDSDFGMLVESRWYLARLLGLKEPQGTESTYALDYYGKRGMGTGAEIRYYRDDYYGRVLGYIIKDSGEDDLGRHQSRRNVEPDHNLRGRFHLIHRHFLPYNWQFTGGLGYASDEQFIEGFYRSEYNVGAGQETYAHLKRLQDNWAVSFLAKARINDFADVLEELPTVEFHLTGQSLFDDSFTLYSDTQISRYLQRIGDEHSTTIDEDVFSFVSHRTELDLPIWADNFKLVPFVAGSFGYDDRSGFRRSLVDGSHSGSFGEDKVWIGEVGIRAATQYHRVYPDVRSRLWDLNKLRHIIRPQLTAVLYEESDDVVRQHDILNFSISQRLQTKRGTTGDKDKQKTVDWMRLDTDFTWVNDSEGPGAAGIDRFIWNRPLVPLRVFSTPEIFSGDLTSRFHRFEMFGPRRNYFSADYVWRVSDTSAILSDINYDMQSGVVQQYNIGLSHMRWPNLQFYIASRYIRRFEMLDEKGTNALIFAVTYRLDPRYTVIFAQQYDFDYKAGIRNDIILIRRYHRMYYGFTYSADESLDRNAIVFSIWPQGVPELAIGSRSYMGLGGAAGY